MLKAFLRRQTLASFDYQWRCLPAGDGMLSDPRFLDHVDDVLSRELVGVAREWFAGKTALDAGCGGGRWTLGLLRLGCRVTAVDSSLHALAQTRAEIERLAPPAMVERLETLPADLLRLPGQLAVRRFDLVFSFGVLHHTGDTQRALANVANLVGPEGLLFVYLYGARSTGWPARLALGIGRLALAPLPFSAKRAVLARLFPRRDPHQTFDLWSPLLNQRLDHATVEGWLRRLGFVDVTRTIPHTDIFVRAARITGSPPFLPPPAPPYWFERYRRRP
jgi:SAM-dependent methyltransferase